MAEFDTTDPTAGDQQSQIPQDLVFNPNTSIEDQLIAAQMSGDTSQVDQLLAQIQFSQQNTGALGTSPDALASPEQLQQQLLASSFIDNNTGQRVLGSDIQKNDPSGFASLLQMFNPTNTAGAGQPSNSLGAFLSANAKGLLTTGLLAGGLGIAAKGLTGPSPTIDPTKILNGVHLNPSQQALLNTVLQSTTDQAAQAKIVNGLIQAALQGNDPGAAMNLYLHNAVSQAGLQSQVTGLAANEINGPVTADLAKEAGIRTQGQTNLSDILKGNVIPSAYFTPQLKNAQDASTLLSNALTGKGPVNVGLERNIQIQRDALIHSLLQAEGPGALESTMGSRALQFNDESANAQRYNADLAYLQPASNAATAANTLVNNQVNTQYNQGLTAAQLAASRGALSSLAAVGTSGAPTSASILGTTLGANPAAVATSGINASAAATNQQTQTLGQIAATNAQTTAAQNNAALGAGGGLIGTALAPALANIFKVQPSDNTTTTR